MSIILKAGSLPAGIVYLEERTVGPSLGRDSIRSGLTAMLAGFLGVMLFMLIYYRLSGVNAVVALALNVAFWLFYGRRHPPLSSDESIRVIGTDEETHPTTTN